MGEFNGKIQAEFSPPRTWELERTLSFVTKELTESEIDCLQKIGANVSNTGRVSAGKGMKTDLATVLDAGANVRRPRKVSGGRSGIPGSGKQARSSGLQWVRCILS